LALVIALALPAVAHADFSFAPGTTKVTALDSAGRRLTQAGAHPDSFTIEFALKQDSSGITEGGEMQDVIINLPPGLAGNPQAVPACTRQQFEGTTPRCPGAAQVGVLRATSPGLGETINPIYIVEPAPGVAAQLGFAVFNFTVLQNAGVRTDEGYGITVAAPNIPLEVTSARAVVWGNPADPSHDAERVCANEPGGAKVGCSTDSPRKAFLSLPTSCSLFEMTVEADSRSGGHARESAFLTDAGGNPAPLVGCQSVPFGPTVAAAPSSTSAETSSGLGVGLNLPNQGLIDPEAITETQPAKLEVALPPGITVNPSAANGIGVCTLQQYGQATCPEDSKIGSLVANTPLLTESIEGAIYLAAPHENPFNSLLAAYVIARAPSRGVLVKQAGEVRADPSTGQLTVTFDRLPPVPYSSLESRLREGPRAPLITPQTCGEYRTVAKLYPYSSPSSVVERTVPFRITSGANGGACASSEAQLPAKPTLEAGSTSPLAGAYAPFVFRIKRADGEQRISAVTATLPTGLLARLNGVPFCSDAAIANAASRTQEGGGALENASPSCPAASQIGIVNVAAGAGSQPYYAQGKVYMAGPYKGAPLSVEIITPAIAGPFDLGSVAVRAALYINESTAQVRAVADPLPTILHGIPLDVRTISVQLDRREFSLNPTNCESKSVAASVTTISGATASLSNHFAVGGCKGLAFKPSLKLAFNGQTKRTGFPAIKAVLTQPKGENANLSGATVILPKGMLIANAHINNPCTRVQFYSGALPGEGCPKKSILGTAKAWTPLLEKPETGKVYFRSNGGERELPDLVVALRGTVPLQLLGFIDSVGAKNAEVRRVRSRFLNIPDAPVSRFELKLDGGKKGLLQNSKNLCKTGNRAKFQLSGQNGKTYDTEPKIQVNCGKKGSGKKG
jgi:hypothetical protein